ncbi:hypothetical protein [Chelativorans alearense]|uniref:hypothetical protein n=1 Tax=Chelativorans alearense TaxID=2681495 RepID=UPI0013D34A20|nr:hypothetical protein [Chelativorans alearense]
MKDDKEPHTAKPGTLLSQWWTLGAIALDRRTAGRHSKVAWVIIDRYMQAKGNGRASVRYIERATGMSGRIIIKACRELVEWGYVSQRVGIGTRPTEYIPNWSSVSPMCNAKADEPSVAPMCNASVSPMCNASDDSAAPMCNKSYLLKPADKPGLQESRNDPAAPSAPPTVGLAATAAETAEEGFEELWRTYGVRRKKADARAAYDKLVPDADQHATMVAAAKAWREAAGDGVERMHLRRWIEQEEYECEPPTAFKAKDKPKKHAAKAGKPQPSAEPFREIRQLLTITSAEVEKEDGSTWLNLYLRDDEEGEEDEAFICLESPNEDAQCKGQRRLNRLTAALGITDLEDSGQLIGLRFVRVLRTKFGEYEYEPAPENESLSESDTMAANDNASCDRSHDDAARAGDYPPTKPRPPRPNFFEVMARHPVSASGWQRDDDDDDEEAEARAGMYFGAHDDDESEAA